MSGFLVALCARDSGGGSAFCGVTQTLKALCTSVYLHSHDTHNGLLCHKHPPTAVFFAALNILLLNQLVE